MEVAKEVGGMIVFIEHRYYGKSIPFGANWRQDLNYQFLTVDQALADYAVILSVLKKDLGNPNRKVIAFGGSYGGMLTAYMRFKYPNIVDGGLAASAPIFPMGKYDFFRAVTDDCHRYNSLCPVRVRSAFTGILKLTESVSGLEKLKAKFHLCSNISADNLQHFLLWIRNSFTIMAMVDYPYAASFLGNLPAYPVNRACDKILAADDALDGLADAVAMFYNSTSGPVQCFNPATEFMACADATGCGKMSQWDIQVCLQVRFPSGTNNVTDMFPPFAPWAPSDYEAYCTKKYGPLSYSHDFFSIDFWSDSIAASSNLIFSNGDLDPWHTGGVLKNIDHAPSIVPILIKGGAHHLDLRGHHEDDPESVVDARNLEVRIIKSWLAAEQLSTAATGPK
ncbi:dipeptidyl peptidase 2-like [Sycon ciliatum]|uniref:dipeptidyl peptidase 2-like n=1 Tax=Sycon ciliatum TaxID=27933 RepID=UPI0031F65128